MLGLANHMGTQLAHASRIGAKNNSTTSLFSSLSNPFCNTISCTNILNTMPSPDHDSLISYFIYIGLCFSLLQYLTA